MSDDANQNTEPTLSRGQWESQRATELQLKSVLELAQKVATLEGDLKEARASRIKDGQVAVTKDDAALLESYRAYGAPEALKTSLEQLSTLQADATKRSRSAQVLTAAKAAQMDGEALEHFMPADASLEVREVEVNGERGQVVYIKTVDGTESVLGDWVTRAVPAVFQSSLRLTEPSVSTPAPVTPSGPAFLPQNSASSSPKPADAMQSAIDAHIAAVSGVKQGA